MKICTKCLKEKPYDEFQKAKGYKDGYQTWCKKCKYENTRKWLKADPERIDRAKEAQSKWYDKEYWASYREANRERVRAANRKYAATHVEERREGYRRRRKQIRGTSTDITVEWLKELKTATVHCPLCDVVLTDGSQHNHTKYNLDHIVPLNVGGTHTRDNVRYICYLCNLRRPKDGADHLLIPDPSD